MIRYCLAFFLIVIVQAQEFSTISGFVREDATGEPVSYADVFLSETSMGAATNVDGYFVITNIPSGQYEIIASMIGYSLYSEEIILSGGQTIRLDIRLNEKIIETSEITVTAERQKFEKLVESSKISPNLREINASPTVVAKTFLSTSRYRFDFNFNVNEKETYTTIDTIENYEVSYGLRLYDIIMDHTL